MCVCELGRARPPRPAAAGLRRHAPRGPGRAAASGRPPPPLPQRLPRPTPGLGELGRPRPWGRAARAGAEARGARGRRQGGGAGRRAARGRRRGPTSARRRGPGALPHLHPHPPPLAPARPRRDGRYGPRAASATAASGPTPLSDAACGRRGAAPGAPGASAAAATTAATTLGRPLPTQLGPQDPPRRRGDRGATGGRARREPRGAGRGAG